jgi:hypothetical protein
VPPLRLVTASPPNPHPRCRASGTCKCAIRGGGRAAAGRPWLCGARAIHGRPLGVPAARSPPAPAAQTRVRAMRTRAAASTSGGGSLTHPPSRQRSRLEHAPRCASADARSADRGSGLAALPQPSQCRPETGLANISKSGRDGQRGAAAQHTHYGAVHRDAGQPRAMPASSAPPGASSARSSALSSRFGAILGANSREFTKMSGAAAAHAATSVRRLHMCDEPRPSMPRQAGTTKAGDPRSYSQHSNAAAHRQELRVCCMQGYLSTLRF